MTSLQTSSTPTDQVLGTLQTFIVPETTSMPGWEIGSMDASEQQLFIPLIDDPSYRVEDLELLGIDLKDLFDFPHFNPGGENGT